MRFTQTKISGVWLIELDRHEDERGWFARSWCAKEFEARGLNPRLVQCNISFNEKRGTVRGMHYQAAPHGEAKLVRCTRGAIYDVVLDLRRDSATFREWVAYELTPDNGRMLFIAEELAHGFQTLEDNSEVFYQMSEFYRPESARGVRWDDAAFAVKWPYRDGAIVSIRDARYPDFT